jgi:HSP20 family protein
MNLVRFDPWSIADFMQRDFDRQVSRRYQHASGETDVADWTPAVDIVEEKGRFVLRADVPGVDPTNIEVSMDDGILSVSGERHAEERSEAEGIQRYERVTGHFYRRFTLPESADAEGIKARSSNGILEIEIPKQPEVQARRITVEAA